MNDSPRSNRRAQLATVAACIAVGAALLLANPQTYTSVSSASETRVPEPSPQSAPVTPRAHSVVAPAADWTVAPCSLWADTAQPVLPPYTRTDVCAYLDQAGMWQLSYAPVQLPTL